MPNVHDRVRKNITAILGRKNLTSESLAHGLEVDKAHISRILSGKKRISLNLLEKIAIELEVDVQRLLKP